MIEPPVDIPRIDDEIARQPEDIRRDLAEAASRDLYLLCKGVLGYPDLTEGCHGHLCHWHDSNDARLKLTLMPRGHLKTHVVTIGKTIQKVIRDQEARILIANETATNAEKFLSAIKLHAEANRRFRALYSHIIPVEPTVWNQQALTFLRRGVYPTPTFTALGMTGAVTSQHFTHLCLDDLISEEAARSRLVMDDVINRASKLYSLMVDPSKDTMDVVGTRWAFYDLYAYFMQRFPDKLARYIRSAIEHGAPIWPERFTPEVLADIRNDPLTGGEYNFSCLYMNNPRDVAVQDFNVQDLKFWRWSDNEEHLVLYNREGEVEKVVDRADLDITITVDVRYEEKLSSDRDAIVVTGTTTSGDAIVLEAWGSRSNPLEVVAQLCHFIKRYEPRCIGIQKAGYEMSLKYHLRAECERLGLYARVVPVKPGGQGKTHIRALQPVAATGHLYVLPTQHALRNELAEYPLGKHDDVADALALQLQLWRGLLSPDRMNKYKQSEERLLRSMRRPDTARFAGMTPSQLEDEGYDPEDHRYGRFHDYQFN